MLRVFTAHQDGQVGQLATDGVWLDLLSPTAAEIANVEKIAGVSLPSLGALSEIESSSRLRNKDGVLYMSTPSTVRHPEGADITPPVGFVLSEKRLATVRFMPLPSFDAVAAKFNGQEIPIRPRGFYPDLRRGCRSRRRYDGASCRRVKQPLDRRLSCRGS